MDFPQRLYELRKQAGLSQEDLANRLDITRQAVQKWEAGTSKPDMGNLIALADTFHVTLDWLIRGTEPSLQPAPQAAAQVSQVQAAEAEAEVEVEVEVEPPRQIIHETIIRHEYGWHYEYKSQRTLFGIPLVHIHLGTRPAVALGILAIGNIAVGGIALGGISLGLLALGGISAALFALGGVTLGVLSLGGLALGYLCLGGVALGVYCMGGIAYASSAAVGGIAAAKSIAIGSIAESSSGQAFPLSPSGTLSPEAAEAARAALAQSVPGWIAAVIKFLLKL